jgi:hypothetical protein
MAASERAFLVLDANVLIDYCAADMVPSRGREQ